MLQSFKAFADADNSIFLQLRFTGLQRTRRMRVHFRLSSLLQLITKTTIRKKKNTNIENQNFN